jgi:hypothetical protein
MEGRRRRQAHNEIVFRSINEQIGAIGPELFETDAGARVWDFICECHRTDCVELLALTPVEYEAVRASGKRFLVAPSPEHVDMEIENVVDMSARYWIVEKTDESAEFAEAGDPRE